MQQEGEDGTIFDLFIVPTAGFDPATGELNEAGQLRMDKAAELIRQGKVRVLLILGGRRVSGPNEANLHFRYFVLNHPDVAEKVPVHVLAPACCTNRDIWKGRKEIRQILSSSGIDRKKARIGATSYTAHLRQIATVLQAIGLRHFQGVESGEKQVYSDRQIGLILGTTYLDPFWLFPPGLIFALMANRRAHQVYTHEK